MLVVGVGASTTTDMRNINAHCHHTGFLIVTDRHKC